MSGANYEFCPGCDRKAFYAGDADVPETVVIWHQACLDKRITEAAAAERERCADLARQVHATFTSSYSFTEGRTKTLPFADYLLADEPSATPGGTP